MRIFTLKFPKRRAVLARVSELQDQVDRIESVLEELTNIPEHLLPEVEKQCPTLAKHLVEKQ